MTIKSKFCIYNLVKKSKITVSLPLVFHRLLLEMILIFTIQVEDYEFASVLEITKLNKTPLKTFKGISPQLLQKRYFSRHFDTF